MVEEVAQQPSRNHPAADVTDLRIATALPQTATNKVLKRELVREGLDVTDPVWTRAERGRSYSASF